MTLFTDIQVNYCNSAAFTSVLIHHYSAWWCYCWHQVCICVLLACDIVWKSWTSAV